MLETRTALCVIAAVASGLFLYSEKRQALMIDREIGGLMRTTANLHIRTALLRAEWASMLGPDRLETMASEHLRLQPVAPAQFVQLDELGAHLPQATAAQSSNGPDDDAPAPDIAAGSIGQAEAATATGSAQPAAVRDDLAAIHAVHDAPLRPAIARPGALQAVIVPAIPKPSMKGAVAKHTPGQHGSAERSLAFASVQQRPFVAPRTVAANTYKAMAGPARPHAINTAVPADGTARPYVASALGNGVALSPPVPYGQ